MNARKHRELTTASPRKRGARTLAEIAGGAIEPALLRRAGLTVKLLAHWPEIAGTLADRTRPVRVKWGKRPHIGEAAAPGTLVLACDGATALRVQHQTEQLIERVNATFGWRAIGRVAIEQRPVSEPARRAVPEELPKDRTAAIDRNVETIEHDRLRHALASLGRSAALREQNPL